MTPPPEPPLQTCARCGHQASMLGGGINGLAYCHTFATERPTCYEVASRELYEPRTLNQYRAALGLRPFEFAEANMYVRLPRRPWWKRLLARWAR